MRYHDRLEVTERRWWVATTSMPFYRDALGLPEPRPAPLAAPYSA